MICYGTLVSWCHHSYSNLCIVCWQFIIIELFNIQFKQATAQILVSYQKNSSFVDTKTKGKKETLQLCHNEKKYSVKHNLNNMLTSMWCKLDDKSGCVSICQAFIPLWVENAVSRPSNVLTMTRLKQNAAITNEVLSKLYQRSWKVSGRAGGGYP